MAKRIARVILRRAQTLMNFNSARYTTFGVITIGNYAFFDTG